MNLMRLFTLAALIILAGCSTKKRVTVWRFTHCAANGSGMVCECRHFHSLVNAKNGAAVQVCE
jgi:uncharacterized lipoprotein YajG